MSSLDSGSSGNISILANSLPHSGIHVNSDREAWRLSWEVAAEGFHARTCQFNNSSELSDWRRVEWIEWGWKVERGWTIEGGSNWWRMVEALKEDERIDRTYMNAQRRKAKTSILEWAMAKSLSSTWVGCAITRARIRLEEYSGWRSESNTKVAKYVDDWLVETCTVRW